MEDNNFQAYQQEMSSLEAQKQYTNQKTYSGLVGLKRQRQNLVEWELDLSEEYEDIERLIRGDILQEDNDGNQRWVKNPNLDERFLNDKGVNDFMRNLKILVNKNKLMSNYTIDEIKERIGLIGHELRHLIYNNYEIYDINNEYKINNFPIIIISVISLLEDAYRRALQGATHKGFNTQTIVSQNEPISNNGQGISINVGNQNQKKAKWFNPFTWGR